MRILVMLSARLSIVAAAFVSVLSASCGPPAQDAVTPTKPVASITPTSTSPDDQPLPLDARITKGTLPSGLTYYILPNKKPEHRAQVWLAVNAGSVLEDDDQRGLAHFVEHMAFNGTKRFPKQAIVDMLEKSGVAFGADLNAYTSFDETVYTLQVPTDKPELLNKAISVLRDWSDGVTFDPTEVEKERGVVLEEWRLGRGAQMRMFDKEAPILFHGSKYAERITIGKPEIIKGAPPQALVRFYKDWYRPELMSVVAVGDFVPSEIEARIKEEFSSLKPSSPQARPRVAVPVPSHADELVAIETDPEATRAAVAIITKLPKRFLKTTRDYRRSVSERLFNSMLNSRLDEIRRREGAPFVMAASTSGGFVRTEDAFTQFAMVKENSVQDGFSALLEEDLRVVRHGFTQTELDRAKADVLRSIERSAKERDTTESRSFAAEIVRNFLDQEAMPGIEAELELTKKLLPTFALDEINKLAESLAKGSRVVTVNGPAAMQTPTEAAILATTKTVEAKNIEAYVDGTSNVPLMATAPTPGTITGAKTIPEIGVTEWTLKNGARVILKPTDFKNDEVRMSAFANGGTSLASDADYESAKFADAVVREGGIGTFDAVSLRKALSGKVVSVNAHVGELEEGVSASASPTDLDSMFQLVYLAFTAPRRDEAAFRSWRAREDEAVKNRALSPNDFFNDELAKFSTQNHLRRMPTTSELLTKIDYDKAFAFYKQRFADASGFTFVFVGNIDLDRTKKLVETYIASLPSANKKENWKDPNVVRPRGVAKKQIAKGSEPKSSVSLTFHGTDAWSRDNDNDMRMLGEVLRIRLREILREDMGGVYGVGASGAITRRPKQQFTFGVSFGCAPENIDKLEKATWDEIQTLQKNGISADYIAKVKELRRRAHETSLKENSWWLTQLEHAYTYGDDPKQIIDFDPWVEKVSSDRVKAAAKKYLTSTQYILAELRPATAHP